MLMVSECAPTLCNERSATQTSWVFIPAKGKAALLRYVISEVSVLAKGVNAGLIEVSFLHEQSPKYMFA